MRRLPSRTDVATTTTLAALPTTVDVGQSTVLTATVSARARPSPATCSSSRAPPSLGTSALAAGTATKSVIVGTAGAHTYSAKFVENTVAAPPTTFLASTSADVTVTATVPAVALPPNGPSENALNASTANGATASYDAATHTGLADRFNAEQQRQDGQRVRLLHADLPRSGGPSPVASITVDVSTLPARRAQAGNRRPRTTGDVHRLGDASPSPMPHQPDRLQDDQRRRGTAMTPADGEFSLTNLSGATVDLTNPALVNGASVVSGELGNFKVTDLRQVSKPGWDLKTEVAAVRQGHRHDRGLRAGHRTDRRSARPARAPRLPPLGAAQVSGSRAYPWNFATLAGHEVLRCQHLQRRPGLHRSRGQAGRYLHLDADPHADLQVTSLG